MNNYKTKTHTKNFKKKEYEFFVIGADIGGTNMNFGLSGVKNGNIELISSVHFKTLNFKKSIILKEQPLQQQVLF